MRFSLLRLVFLTAITAAIGTKALLWIYRPAATDVRLPAADSARHETAGPAGRSVIAGTVYDEHGRPASGRSVRLMRTEDPQAGNELPRARMTIKSDEEGRYRFDALPAGSYLVLAAFNDLATARVFHPGASRVAEASPVPVSDGEERTGVDLRYRPSPAALVEGVVTLPDGTPVRITVDLILSRAPEPERVRLTTGTDDQGRFSFGDVPADEYWIVAHTQVRGTVSADRPVGSRPLVAIADVTTDGRTPAMVTLVARPAMTVSARLMFPDTAAASVPDPHERSGMMRLAGRDHRSRALLALIDTPTRSDAGGLVTFHGVPAGRYALIASLTPDWRITSASFAREAWPSLTLDVAQGVDLDGIEIGVERNEHRASK
jgi:hypothetical protein